MFVNFALPYSIGSKGNLLNNYIMLEASKTKIFEGTKTRIGGKCYRILLAYELVKGISGKNVCTIFEEYRSQSAIVDMNMYSIFQNYSKRVLGIRMGAHCMVPCLTAMAFCIKAVFKRPKFHLENTYQSNL